MTSAYSPRQRGTSLAGVSLRDLEYVVAVADLGCFNAAADRCAVSQPSLSAQVRKVEAWAKLQIFERTTRKVLTTERGERFVAQARRVLEEARLLSSFTRSDTQPFGDQLRLSAIATVGPYLFPLILKGLRKEYPSLAFKLGEGLTAPLIAALRRGEVDAVVMSLPVEDPSLVCRPLYHEPFLLACPEEMALPDAAEQAWSMLLPEDQLLLEEGHCLRDQALATCGSTGRRDRYGASLQTLKYMVASGEGCTLVPALAVAQLDGVRYRPGITKGFSRDIALAWRRTDDRSEQLETLADHLKRIALAAAPRIAPVDQS